MKTKTNIGHSNLFLKIVLLFFLIFFLVLFFLIRFNEKVTPKLVHVAELKLNKYMEHTASSFKLFQLEKNLSNQLLKIKENEKGEIQAIDYDMPKIYALAESFTNSLETNINQTDIFQDSNSILDADFSSKDGILLFLPIGVVSDYVFFSNLGPKIPVFIHFIGSIFSNIKTRVTDYGINNVLMEVFLEVSISYEILTPITMEEKELNYELLLDSKVIQGVVPNLYGGLMESKSVFFSVPF